MIVPKNEIPIDTFHIIKLDNNLFIPNYIIKLPLLKDENLKLECVDCIFSIIDSRTTALKVVGIESFNEIDFQKINDKKFGKYLPEFIYVFKQGILDLDKTRSKYLK